MKKIFSFLSLALLVMTSGCIENDIDYAVVPLSISELNVEGQIGESVISEDKRTVKIKVGTGVNLKKVKVKTIEYVARYAKDTSYVDVQPIRSSFSGDFMDLSAPLTITLSLYQDYDWTITAEQIVTRELKVEGQIGNVNTIDEEKRSITAYIAKDGDLSDIKVKKLKLSSDGTSVNPDELHWIISDDNTYAEAKAMVNNGQDGNEEWTVRVERLIHGVITFSAHPWVNVAWLNGFGTDPVLSTFEYREVGTESWIAAGGVTSGKDGEFSSRINGLKADTDYEYRAVYDKVPSNVVRFRTYSSGEIPNMGFEDWSTQDKKVVCPWAEGDETYWDCGNWGSTTLGARYNITTPDENVPEGSKGKYSARLETKNILGILATGNMFVGKYKKTLGFNGLLGMGRKFESFPTRLTGYYKYVGKKITHTSKGFEKLKNITDSCFIYVALGDWEDDGEGTYVKIQTDNGDNQGTYFDVNDPHVIAYGSLTTSEKIEDFTKFSIELEYRAHDRRPTAIMIVCAASKYGDYFTGAPGSILWIDDFNLEYDY